MILTPKLEIKPDLVDWIGFIALGLEVTEDQAIAKLLEMARDYVNTNAWGLILKKYKGK